MLLARALDLALPRDRVLLVVRVEYLHQVHQAVLSEVERLWFQRKMSLGALTLLVESDQLRGPPRVARMRPKHHLLILRTVPGRGYAADNEFLSARRFLCEMEAGVCSRTVLHGDKVVQVEARRDLWRDEAALGVP